MFEENRIYNNVNDRVRGQREGEYYNDYNIGVRYLIVFPYDPPLTTRSATFSFLLFAFFSFIPTLSYNGPLRTPSL